MKQPTYCVVAKMQRESGFGLIEMMVSMVIALLASVAIYQTFNSSEGFRRSTLGNGNAQSSGGIAVIQIQKNLERAGYGISVNTALNCNVVSNNAQFSNFPLVPVLIESGARSDRLTILYSNSNAGGMPALFGEATNHSYGDDQFANILLAGQYKTNDLVVIWPDSGSGAAANCPLFQVTCTNGNCPAGNQPISTKDFALGHSDNAWNSRNQNAPFPESLPLSTTRLMNFGSMVRRSYCVYQSGNPNACNGATDLSDGSLISQDALDGKTALDGKWKTTTENIIQLKAQYGLDTGPGADHIANTVQKWTNTTPTDNKTWKQLIAIRYAVLVRSAYAEKPDRTGQCNASKDGQKFKWSGGDFAEPENALGSNTDWKCYRYSVHETVVPLRNQLILNQPDLIK
ncbi:PilW family protein [Iodobacter sp.]|uniref:PilW family protein n=1 Tax=Iodobacter sp. TaxID=1915058 RepID=UPI0025F49366|nr:PilW family protein [Iodobacter sp.]